MYLCLSLYVTLRGCGICPADTCEVSLWEEACSATRCQGDCFLEKLEPSFAEPKDEDGRTLTTLRNKGLIGPY